MTGANPDITGNNIIDRQAGGDRDDDRRDATSDTTAEDRSFHTSTVQANRSVEDGNGVGQRELDAQADPNEDNSLVENQLDLNARADASRDNHQTPRGNDAVRDTADNLGGGD